MEEDEPQQQPTPKPDKTSQKFELFEHVYQLYPHLPQYDLENKTIQKYEFLLQRFTQLYGCQPTFYVKSPGRVVLFGEVGSDYPTVEMCIPRDVIVVLAVNDRKEVRVNHFDKTVHPQQKLPVEVSELKLSTEDKSDDYLNLLVMALKICGTFSGESNFVSRGLDVFVFSDFVSRAKLAHTSALAYGLTLAFLAANKLATRIKKQHFAEQIQKWKATLPQLCLNQVQIFGQNNRLTVLPDRTSLDFLKEYTFVLANSLTPEPTKLTEGKRTNLRYCQLLLGIEIIKSELGISRDFANVRTTLCYSGELQDNLGYSTDDMIDCVEQSVPNRSLSCEELEKLVERPLIEVLRTVPFANVVLQQNTHFHPFKRMMYLLLEDKHINELTKLLSSSRPGKEKCEEVSRLLTASHKLTKEMLEVDSKQISRLIEVAGESGLPLTFKLVGNGWGGNVLFWLPRQHQERLIEHLTTSYYLAPENQVLMSCESDEYVFEVVPSRALSLLDPQYEMWF